MMEVEDQEPEIIRNPWRSWIFGISIAVLIVLIFSWAASRNTRNDQPWSPTTGTSAPG
jgi:hypothetical protein